MYTNPQCENIEEFYEDMNRIKYIKRLLGRYHNKGLLRERLVLNHIIIEDIPTDHKVDKLLEDLK